MNHPPENKKHRGRAKGNRGRPGTPIPKKIYKYLAVHIASSHPRIISTRLPCGASFPYDRVHLNFCLGGNPAHFKPIACGFG